MSDISDKYEYEVRIPMGVDAHSPSQIIEWFYFDPTGGGNGRMRVDLQMDDDLQLETRVRFTNVEDFVAFKIAFSK